MGTDDLNSRLRQALDNQRIEEYTTSLAELRRGRFAEERYFEIYLIDSSGLRSEKPVIEGIYFAGRGEGLRPWMEVRYISQGRLDLRLFELLSNLISPGGRLMVEYGVTEETHASTARALQLGIPPVVTPLGYLLWQSGFRAFKDWYFPEGWREGETKLQGDKLLNADQERRMAEKLVKDLQRFLNREPREDLKEWEEPAREVAKKILKELR